MLTMVLRRICSRLVPVCKPGTPEVRIYMYEQEPPAQNYIAVAWKSGRQIWVCGAQLTGNHLYMEVPATAGLYVEPEIDMKDQKLQQKEQ